MKVLSKPEVSDVKSRFPKDYDNVKNIRYDNVHDTRYIEIILVEKDAATGELIGSVYNTLGQNSPTGKGDTCPADILEKIDFNALKEEYKVDSIILNGPRRWTLDWLEVITGQIRDFDGLKASWVMWFDVPREMITHKSIAYKPATGKRDTQFGINKGSPAFILNDPDGNSWVMKSMSLTVDPHQTYEGLKDLGSRLHLPSGWSFRVVTLERDLVLTPDNGHARITQDDLNNIYDRVGGPYSNYVP